MRSAHQLNCPNFQALNSDKTARVEEGIIGRRVLSDVFKLILGISTIGKDKYIVHANAIKLDLFPLICYLYILI